jgi:hypothetical protein
MMKQPVAFLLVLSIACGPAGAKKPVTNSKNAPIGETSALSLAPPTVDSPKVKPIHPVKSKLEQPGSVVFIAHRRTCERAIVKHGEKGERRILEVDASSTEGCFKASASIAFDLYADHADLVETRLTGQYRDQVTTFPAFYKKSSSLEAASETELLIDGERLFADEETCKQTLALPAPAPKPERQAYGWLANAVAAAIAQRRPPPSGAFVDRFEKLVRRGGQIWVPSDLATSACMPATIASQIDKSDVERLTITLTYRMINAHQERIVDVIGYGYDTKCKRLKHLPTRREVTFTDGSVVRDDLKFDLPDGDLTEQRGMPDELPLIDPAFYTQAACLAYTKENP